MFIDRTTTLEAIIPQELLQNPHILLHLYQDLSIHMFHPSQNRHQYLLGLSTGHGRFSPLAAALIHEHCHLAAIPHAPDTLDPKNATHILFTRAIDEEHSILNNGQTLRNLSRDMLQQLKAMAVNLQTKAEKYWADDSSAKKNPIFANILGVVKLYLEAFECLPMTFHQVTFTFTEL
ncbi:hypothetical protein M413DRAFT_31886 [Hebeloma cylindrosporum]|uniref:Uncharacterized protein n=1 Tax=Hebeloma cylindrosporum TaxID=76867 RepID=A0A0C3BXJ2_HEBCY|nr:hypothetical protein M413DRAFT_31886 [Hebeloma cylindrosporum h7]